MNKAVLSLNFMYCMERFATALYRIQRGAFARTAVIDKLMFAVNNEGEHATNIRNHILKLNNTPSPFAFLFQILGVLLGLVSRCFGRIFMLKADIVIEKRAVKDYGYFLKTLKLNDNVKLMIKDIIADEELHIRNWHDAMKILKD